MSGGRTLVRICKGKAIKLAGGLFMEKIKKMLAVVICAVITVTFTLTANADSEQNGFLYRFIDNSNVIEISGISPNGILSDAQSIELPYSLRGVSVIQIGKSAFTNNGKIQNIHMTENILQICDDAMYGMKALKSITLPKHLSVLGKRAFSYCTSLENVSFETTELRQIQEFTFYGCTSLNNVILSSSVLELDDHCFGHCLSLDKIYIPPSVTKIEQTAFYSTKNGLTVYGDGDSEAHRYAVKNNINFIDVSKKNLNGLYRSISSAQYLRNRMNALMYTEESVAAFTEAYNNAVEVKENFFSTPDEVQAALQSLNNSMSGLQEVTKYDIDGDGSIMLSDVVLMQKRLLSNYNYSAREIYAADFNGDGAVTLADIVLFQRYILSI